MEEEIKQEIEAETVVKENLTTEQDVTVSELETVVPEPDQSERIRLENEAYQRHVSALMAELQEIREQFHVQEPTPPDPVSVLTGEVNSLKNGFDELKQIIAEQQRVGNHQNNQPQGQPQFNQPQQAFPYFPQQGFQFFPQQPMFQTSTIMPAPSLPYIATSTPMPTNFQVPQFNMNNQNGNMN